MSLLAPLDAYIDLISSQGSAVSMLIVGPSQEVKSEDSANALSSYLRPEKKAGADPKNTYTSVPPEYAVGKLVSDAVPPLKVNKLSDDTLFFLFYNCSGERWQHLAAAELYNRDWRYHTKLLLWIILAPKHTKSAASSVGTRAALADDRPLFIVFDHNSWSTKVRSLNLDYNDLAPRQPSSFPTYDANLLSSFATSPSADCT